MSLFVDAMESAAKRARKEETSALLGAVLLIGNVGDTLLKFIEHKDIQFVLRVARDVGRCRHLAMTAVYVQGFTFKTIHPMFAKDRSIAEKAIKCFQGGIEEEEALWRSIHPKFTSDPVFAGCSCGFALDFLYPNMISHAMREDQTFIINFIQSIKNTEDASYEFHKYLDLVPDDMMANRAVALLCAQKGLWSFGKRERLWTTDKEIISAFLQHGCRGCREDLCDEVAVMARTLDDSFSFVRKQIKENPVCAPILTPSITSLAEFQEIFDIIVSHNTSILMYFDRVRFVRNSVHPSLWNRVWRQLVRADLLSMNFIELDDINDHNPADIQLVVDVAIRKSFLCFHFQSSSLQNSEHVAAAVFAARGRLIENTKWLDTKSMALIAVQQDGRALRHVSCRLRSDFDVIRAAVHQTWLALAWVIWDCHLSGFYNIREEVHREALSQHPDARLLIEL